LIYQGGPTVQRFSSIFSQLLQLFRRLEFEQAVKKHRSDFASKGFTSWGQFIAMLFGQFGRAHSLSQICGGLVVVESGRPASAPVVRLPGSFRVAE